MNTSPHPALDPLSIQFDAEVAFCAEHSLELDSASDYGWLVRTATPAHNGPVLGCIDQLDTSVELMRLDGGFSWATFASLHDALEEIVADKAAGPPNTPEPYGDRRHGSNTPHSSVAADENAIANEFVHVLHSWISEIASSAAGRSVHHGPAYLR